MDGCYCSRGGKKKKFVPSLKRVCNKAVSIPKGKGRHSSENTAVLFSGFHSKPYLNDETTAENSQELGFVDSQW